MAEVKTKVRDEVTHEEEEAKNKNGLERVALVHPHASDGEDLHIDDVVDGAHNVARTKYDCDYFHEFLLFFKVLT